jgi:oligopeptide/dipeptide ABC transporter ATP-binding protein
MKQPLLEIQGLHVHFNTAHGTLHAVNGVDLRVFKHEALGLVGETGCGKSMTALSVLRLIPPPGRLVRGSIVFEGEELTQKSEAELRAVRGDRISIVFQNPGAALNPVYHVQAQPLDVLKYHRGLKKEEARHRFLDLLGRLEMPDPVRIARSYPHELSGGMQQRVMIAMAMLGNPALLIADEPTSALDVTIQAQILRLLKSIRSEFDTSVLFITHDLGIVAQFCDRVAVMYLGRVVEVADVLSIFESAQHPYTQGLLRSIPRITRSQRYLEALPGSVPSGVDLPHGCHFHPRCPRAQAQCRQQEPSLQEVLPGHRVACHYAGRVVRSE